MFSITVTEKGGEQRRLDFDKPEITIGRVQGNDVILPKGNVSKRHARIVLKDAKFIIVDLKSTNGTYVNGRKITSPLVVKETDKIYIGDFILGVEESAGGQPRAAEPISQSRMEGSPAPLPPMNHELGPGSMGGDAAMPMRMAPDPTAPVQRPHPGHGGPLPGPPPGMQMPVMPAMPPAGPPLPMQGMAGM